MGYRKKKAINFVPPGLDHTRIVIGTNTTSCVPWVAHSSITITWIVCFPNFAGPFHINGIHCNGFHKSVASRNNLNHEVVGTEITMNQVQAFQNGNNLPKSTVNFNTLLKHHLIVADGKII